MVLIDTTNTKRKIQIHTYNPIKLEHAKLLSYLKNSSLVFSLYIYIYISKAKAYRINTKKIWLTLLVRSARINQ